MIPEGCAPSQTLILRASLILGAILLLLCARGDLWLDEIWSFEWAERAGSPWDILRIFPHDNNHPVNSWWLMAIGSGSPPLACRALSLLCGLVALLLIGRLAAVLAPASRGMATALAAFSFPLVLYFSEARGYAPAIACSLAAAAILVESRSRPPVFLAILFWLVCAAGMLSHATFLLALAALAVWKIIAIAGGKEGQPPACPSQTIADDEKGIGGRVRCPQRSEDGRLGTCNAGRETAEARLSTRPTEIAYAVVQILSAGAAWFAVPGLAAVALYLGFLRPMQIGGGPEYSLATVLGHFFGYALGLPVDGPWAWVSIAAGCALYILGIFFGLRESRIPRIRWLFALLPLMAAAGLIFTRPEVLYFRYFLVFLPFFYLALAALLARLLAARTWPVRAGAGIFLAAYVAAQAPRLFDLATLGRGGYREALRLVAVSPFANKAVTSDHDERNKAILDFIVRRDSLCRGVSYLRLSEAGAGRAGWLVRHSQAPLREKPALYMHSPMGTYRFVATFPYAGVSGWHWFLYRDESVSLPFMTKMSQGELPPLR